MTKFIAPCYAQVLSILTSGMLLLQTELVASHTPKSSRERSFAFLRLEM